MWVRWKYAEQSAAFNNPLLFELHGEVAVERLSSACAALVDRYDVLRARFVESGDSVVQEIAPRRRPALDIHDISELPEGLREERKQALVDAVVSAPFDLARDPVYRFALVRLAADRHLLLMNIHHICTDGVSAAILLGEIAADYKGEEPPAPVGPSIERFLELEAQTPVSEREEAERYWTQMLQNAQPRVDFAMIRRIMRNRRAQEIDTERSDRGSRRYVFKLQADERQALIALAKRTRSTLFMVLVAAFDILLWRYTGQTDLTLVFPVDIRPRTHKQQFGCMINYLPLPLSLDAGMTVAELIRAAVVARSGSRKFKSYPHLDISRIARKKGRPFNTAITAANFALDAFSLEGLEVRPELVFSGEAKEDLGLLFDGQGSELVLIFEYRRTLFDDEVIHEMAADLAHLLAEMAANEKHRLDELTLRGDRPFAERFVARESEAAADGEDLSRMLDARLHAAGERVVAKGETGALSGRTTRALTAGMVQLLRDRGVGPGDRVAVQLSRSPSLLPAILGVWELGAIYVPLDPDLPPARKRFILDHAAPGLVLTDSDVVGLEAREPLDDHDERAADELAYIIYTSGSTGQPKGVEVTRANLVSFLRAMEERLPVGPESRLLAVTTIGFDISLLEMFLPLVTGATVFIYPARLVRDAFTLPTLLDRERINVLQATPSFFRMLIAAGWAGKSDLVALAGGEHLESATAEVLLRGCRELWNLYGPTETTVWSMAARIEDPATIELGRPIPGTSIELLGPDGFLAPRYGRGEIYIRGPGVSPGYRDRPDLNAKRFVDLPGGRAYRTGDIALRSGDDKLYFVGRADHQIKVRGFRVELGEIEAQMEALPGVQKAVVLAFTGGSGERTLAAFVEPSNRGRIDEQTLRSSLAESLPLYMLPSLVRVLHEWPVGPSGKIDRQALERALVAPSPLSPPSPQRTASSASVPDAPTDALTQALARIYADVLGSAPADPSRNLFELGGDSLSGARIVARIRDELSLVVPFQSFMAGSSLEGALQLALEAERVAPQERSRHLEQAHPRRGFPLPAGSVRVLLSDRVLGRSFQSTLGRLFAIDGPVDVERLRQAIDTARGDFLLDHLRLEAEVRGQAIPDDDGGLRYWNEIELDAPDADILTLCRRWLETPLDPARGQLFKCLLVRAGARHYLGLAAHHAALDGASSHRFLRAMSAHYLGRPAPAGCDVAQTERHVESERRRAEVEHDAVLAHFRERLEDWQYFEFGAAIAPYAADASQTMTLVFDSQAALALSERVRAAGVGQFSFFVALLIQHLAAKNATEDVCLGVVHSLRDPVADRAVFGNLTNVLPVHARGVPGRGLAALSAEIQAQLLADQAHTAVPFQALINELPDCRKLGLPPMFSVLAVEEVVGDEALTLGENTTVRLIDSGFTTNLYDLTMRVRLSDHGRVSFDYNPTRVDRETVAALARAVAEVAGGRLHEGGVQHARTAAAFAPPPDARARSVDPQAILAIINEVLGQQSSDRDRSFLMSGGNSVTAARAVAMLRSRLGIDARVYDVLTVPTIGELVESLVSGRASDARPAGPQQQALFFMHEAASCQAAYNIPVALRIEPGLAIDRLRSAVDAIVAREPVLRARFERSASGVVETTRPAAQSIVEAHGPVDDETFAAIMDESISRPFDLARDLLLRVHHASLGDGVDALLIVFHHLIADGVSCGNFLRRLARVYQGHEFTASDTSQRDPRDATDRESRLAQLLAEFPLRDQRATLPYARPFPGARTLEGSVYEFELDPVQREALGALSAARGLPMSALAFAAVSFALHHVSRQHEINIGIATMNRTAANVDALGLYTNTVVLPVSLDPQELVGDALDRIARELFSVCRYADVPFPDVAARVVDSPDLGVTPLFQVFFNFIDRGIYALESDAFRVSEIPARPKGSKFELSIEIHDLGDAMKIVLEYSTDVFDRATVAAVGELLRRILRALGDALDKRLRRMLRSVR